MLLIQNNLKIQMKKVEGLLKQHAAQQQSVAKILKGKYISRPDLIYNNVRLPQIPTNTQYSFLQVKK